MEKTFNIKITKLANRWEGDTATKGTNWSDHKAHLILVEQEDGTFEATKIKTPQLLAMLDSGTKIEIEDWRTNDYGNPPKEAAKQMISDLGLGESSL